jgi:sRNA-binding regulator protein Hfq
VAEIRSDRRPAGERRPRAGGPAGDDARRKPLPPEKTHAEEFYYLKQMAARPVLVFVLDSGETVRGRVEWYDRDCVKVHRDDGPNLLLYKRHIRYVHKEGEDRSDE